MSENACLLYARLSPRGAVVARVHRLAAVATAGRKKMSRHLNHLLQQHAVEHAVVDGFVQVY